MPLAGATGLAIFALGLIIPLLPGFYIALGGEPQHAPYAFSLYSLASLLSAPLWGRVADKWGRRPVMLVALTGTLLSYLWLFFAHTPLGLMVARLLAGLVAGWLVASQAYVADFTSPSQRSKGMGLLGAAFGLGFTLGPSVAALIMAKSGSHPTLEQYHIPLLLAMLSAGVAMVIALLAIKEPPRHTDGLTIGPSLWGTRFAMLKHPQVARLLAVYALVYLVFTCFEGVFAIWANQKLAYGPADIGKLLAFAGLIGIIIQGGLIHRLSQRFGETNLVKFAWGLLGLGMIAFALTSSPSLLWLGISLIGVAMACFNPSMQSLLSKAVGPSLQGSVSGAGQSVSSFARVLGPVIGAQSFALIGVAAPFWLAFTILIIASPLAWLALSVSRLPSISAR